jgi:hypothetical protein
MLHGLLTKIQAGSEAGVSWDDNEVKCFKTYVPRC